MHGFAPIPPDLLPDAVSTRQSDAVAGLPLSKPKMEKLLHLLKALSKEISSNLAYVTSQRDQFTDELARFNEELQRVDSNLGAMKVTGHTPSEINTTTATQR